MQFGFCQQDALIQELGGAKEVGAIFLKFQQMSMFKVAGLLVSVSCHQLREHEVLMTMVIGSEHPGVWFAINNRR